MSEPQCRTCYLAGLTIDELQRAHQEPIAGTIYYCAQHQAAADALTASIDWSTLQVARPLDSYTMLPFTTAAPESRSTPGPSTGTPEPSQAVSEAQADAWDKGYASGFSNAMRRMSDEPQAPTTSNPFRAVLASVDAPAPDEVRGACTPERVMAATGWSRERIAGLAGHFGATLPAPDETAADDDTLREAIDDAVWDVLSGFHEVMDVEARADEVADAVLAVLRNRGLIR